MKKYLRWQGLLGLILFLALIAGFIYVFAGWLIKTGIEQGGGWYLGAEVNVKEVNVNWSPFTVDIVEFQATDPNAPEFNAMQFKQAKAQVNLWQYLLGKVIVEDLTLAELEFGAKRASKGDVYRSADDGKGSLDETVAKVKEVELPDIQQLLQNSNLITVKKAEQLEQVYNTEKTQLSQLKDNLPDEQKLEFYKQKVKEIQDTKIETPQDLVKLKAQLDELKKEIKADKTQLSQAKDQLKTSKDNITLAVTELKQAPDQDWQAVKTKYQLDSFEAEDVAHIIFGEKGREYYNQGMDIYQMLKPFLQSDKAAAEDEEAIVDVGQFIHFTEQAPQPDWLIEKGLVSVKTAQGQFSLNLSEINMQHWKRNQASLIEVSSNQLKGNGSISGKIDFFKAKDGNLLSEGKWLLEQLQIGQTQSAEAGETVEQAAQSALSLVAAKLFADGQFKLNNFDIDAVLKLNLVDPEFITNASKGWQQKIVQALNDAGKIPAEIDLTGNVMSPNWQLHSQVDEIIKGSITQQVDAKLTEFKADLQTKLSEKVASSLKLSNEQAGEIANLDAWLNDADGTLDNLLNTQLKSAVDREKEKAKDKVKDEVGDKLKGLFGK
ncbi:TIGR03545 family protein [Catenovulum sp. 2E275]|uniref:TIGR03545 family protein n=1 Tax=Catenovulum sp. 2E275 TaxID=2980497 RepID=UPI0021D0EA81|nr:TIGR03545 family protein [Catenovulum sp. 2E275]MCU4674244.1 TIGR03545 family protein [Catenovulum sp. 2E275]